MNKIKIQYITTDGKSFDTQIEAINHQTKQDNRLKERAKKVEKLDELAQSESSLAFDSALEYHRLEPSDFISEAITSSLGQVWILDTAVRILKDNLDLEEVMEDLEEIWKDEIKIKKVS